MNPAGKTTSLYFLHAVSPLHVGVGEGLGAINLPIARERATGYPYVPGSSVKGVLREAGELAAGENDPRVITAFGPPTDRAAEARGGLVFSDASLLCLPVRSLLGTFAWVTAPVVLARLLRDLGEAGVTVPGLGALAFEASEASEARTLLTKDSRLLLRDKDGKPSGPLYLEELLIKDYKGESEEATQCATWLSEQLWPSAGGESGGLTRAFFVRRFLLVSDDLFGFLSRTAIEVRSRVKIDDETGTAAASGPWLEEALPAETILHGLIMARATKLFGIQRDKDGRSKPRGESEEGEKKTAAQVQGAFRELRISSTLRFGGKASVGMGRVRFQVVGP